MTCTARIASIARPADDLTSHYGLQEDIHVDVVITSYMYMYLFCRCQSTHYDTYWCILLLMHIMTSMLTGKVDKVLWLLSATPDQDASTQLDIYMWYMMQDIPLRKLSSDCAVCHPLRWCINWMYTALNVMYYGNIFWKLVHNIRPFGYVTPLNRWMRETHTCTYAYHYANTTYLYSA